MNSKQNMRSLLTREERLPLHSKAKSNNDAYESIAIANNPLLFTEAIPELQAYHSPSSADVHPLKSSPGAHPLKSSPGAHPLKSSPGANPLKSTAGVNPLRKSKLWKKVHKRVGSILVNEHDTIVEKLNEQKDSQRDALLKFSFYECLFPILGYLLLGTASYSFLFEDWPIVDSLYFAVVTFTTVGYGDLVPQTDMGKLFTCIFATTGVAYLGFLLGNIGHNIIQINLANIDKARQENNSSILTLFDKSESEKTVGGSKITTEEKKQPETDPWESFLTISKYVTIFSFLYLGALIIGSDQKWDLIGTFYYFTITSLTIGYGDSIPDKSSTKIFAIFYIVFAVGTVGTLVGNVATWVIDKKTASYLNSLQLRELTTQDLAKMDADGDGDVTKLEFVEFLLLSMDKVDKELLDALHSQFDRFDHDKTGVISREDLKRHVVKKLKNVKNKLELSNYKRQLLRAKNAQRKQKRSYQ